MGVLSWALADTGAFAEGRCGRVEADKQTGRVVRDTAEDVGKSCIAPTPLPQVYKCHLEATTLGMQLANKCSVGKIADWPGRFLKTWSAPRQPYFFGGYMISCNLCIKSWVRHVANLQLPCKQLLFSTSAQRAASLAIGSRSSSVLLAQSKLPHCSKCTCRDSKQSHNAFILLPRQQLNIHPNWLHLHPVSRIRACEALA